MSKCVYCIPQTSGTLYTDFGPLTTAPAVQIQTMIGPTTTTHPKTTTSRVATTVRSEGITTRKIDMKTITRPGKGVNNIYPLLLTTPSSRPYSRGPGSVNDRETTATIIAICFAVTLVLVVSLVAVVFFIKNRRRRRQRRTEKSYKMESGVTKKIGEEYDDVKITNTSNETTQHGNAYDYAYDISKHPAPYHSLGRKDAPNIYEEIQRATHLQNEIPITSKPKQESDKTAKPRELTLDGKGLENDNKNYQNEAVTQDSYLYPIVLKQQVSEKIYHAAYVKVLP